MTKKLICFLWLVCSATCFSYTLFAAGAEKSAALSTAPVSLNAQVASRGLDWVHIKWNPYPGADSYLLTYNPVVAAGQSTSLIVTGVEATISNLQFAVSYNVDIQPLCSGLPCPGSAIESLVIDGIIIDLDIKLLPPSFFERQIGYQYNIVPCTCTFWLNPATTVWAKVYQTVDGQPSPYTPFKLYIVDDEVHVKQAVGDNPLGACMVRFNDPDNCSSAGQTEKIKVLNVNQQLQGIIEFTVNQDMSNNEFEVTMVPNFNIGSNYHLAWYRPANQGKSGNGNQEPTELDPNENIASDGFEAETSSASFQDDWKVICPITDKLLLWTPGINGQCRISVFNQQGECLMSKYQTEQVDNFVLPAENLPAGMYFVRVEANGQVKTLKAVKAK